MFERFTDRARRAVVMSQEEARLLNHDYIGTEHLLLGLLHEPEGLAGRALEELGISLATARAEVEAIVSRGDRAPEGHVPFTPRAKKTLELGLREALALGHNYIGTEHILLGLVREGEGVAALVLAQLGADLASVRAKVVELLRDHVSAGGSPPEPITSIPYEAAKLSGGKPLESEHYLLALFSFPESRATRALEALGLTREAVEAALAALDPPPAEGESQSPPAG